MAILKKTVFKARSSGDVAIFDVEGEFTRLTQTSPTLSELVKATLNEGRSLILVNFEKALSVDSYGVGDLLTSFISTQNSYGTFKLCRIPAKLLLIFKITQLDKVLSIYPSEEDALQAFAR